MRLSFISISFFLWAILIHLNCQNNSIKTNDHPDIIFHIVDPKTSDLQFYLSDKNEQNYLTFERLRNDLKQQNKTLVFAMNGGMFNKDFTPQGLYIEDGKTIAPIDLNEKGYGNFYLQPNGIFYLSKNHTGQVVSSQAFVPNSSIEFATQSGPMLIIENEIHPAFQEGSSNVHFRNGVGILPNGQIIFAISKRKINFYSFALFFKEKGCKNALYLDGFVSRIYLPQQNQIQMDGKFGVIIGETQKNNL